MELCLITGNKNKFLEFSERISRLKQLDIDLDEIQSLNPEEIVRHKLEQAKKHSPDRAFIVEDTSLFLDCLNGLPGPLIKFFMKTIGNIGLYELAEKLGNKGAEAKTIIGLSMDGEIMFFEGSLKGIIVEPKECHGFGWDPIFKPLNHGKTFAEMSLEEKNEISMRAIAINKLSDFLKIIH